MQGVFIENGPQDYQILQQEDGFAEISMSGTAVIPDEIQKRNPRIMIQLLDENSGTNMIPPVMAEIKDGCWKASFMAPTGGLYTIRTMVRYGEREVTESEE